MKIKNNHPLVYFFLLGVISTLGAIYVLSILYFSEKGAAENFPQDYKIISPRMPGNLEFAGEKVPLEDYEVYERMEREFIVHTYFHSYTIFAIKRANRWFPVIEPILKKNSIPDDFKYLMVAESNMENVISPAGATGFWQFLKETGIKYELEINDLVDERYHVEKSTEAACKYLKESYAQFGSWTMAAASYNMGTNGTQNQVERQKTDNYYNLMLNIETSRYLGRIISLKYIMQNPDLYGFDIKKNELYDPLKFKEIILDSSVSDIAEYAESLGMNYKILKMYNPWLRDNYLNNSTKITYKIKIPEEGSIEIIN
ncbi:MAG TPA: lytic transglycosylase domain-containing protein [Ignavibacteriaceae bacterium]|nr:lytic transglycosylase domain-containing protein [Ignavibacteriaceae bacterium]